MNRIRDCVSSHCLLIVSVLSVSAWLLLASVGNGQVAEADHQTHAKNDELTLSQQLSELQTKVAKLEEAMKQNHQSTVKAEQGMVTRDSMRGEAMPRMGKMDGGMMGVQMGMMSGRRSMQSGPGMEGKENMPTMGGMPGSGSPGMGGMSAMGMMGGEGMSMMGQMQGMGQMQMPSALPGFAGASHIYHIGATSFFLDHPQHIALEQDQQIKLNQVKESALLAQATFDRWISQGEQELWVLTSSDEPSADAIEAKIREIEKLRSNKRIAYIRAVGEAARILTNEQRQLLVGTLLPSDEAQNTHN